MDARIKSLALCFLIVVSRACPIWAGEYATPNFRVNADTVEIAQQIAEQAERSRSELALEWLGEELPKWHRPCVVRVRAGTMGAGGVTKFTFQNGEVFGWNMQIQGSLERLLDSVVPHEVSHTIFACYFRRPLPRWADEGAATLAEHEVERRRQFELVRRTWNTQGRIPIQRLLQLKDYPTDHQQVMTLYSEGYSLCEFLVQRGGRRRYLGLLTSAEKEGWEVAFRKHYDYESLSQLEEDYGKWIQDDFPQLLSDLRDRPDSSSLVLRGQSPSDLMEKRNSSVARTEQKAVLKQPGQKRTIPSGWKARVRSNTVRSNPVRTEAGEKFYLPILRERRRTIPVVAEGRSG